mmetsp:Transcript_41758/g.101910  ORF Transcript_41758/g.101910 Transcript_41758/m.101910 type:complete len:294 (-) Transcript_41758:2210-3091(-)
MPVRLSAPYSAASSSLRRYSLTCLLEVKSRSSAATSHTAWSSTSSLRVVSPPMRIGSEVSLLSSALRDVRPPSSGNTPSSSVIWFLAIVRAVSPVMPPTNTGSSISLKPDRSRWRVLRVLCTTCANALICSIPCSTTTAGGRSMLGLPAAENSVSDVSARMLRGSLTRELSLSVTTPRLVSPPRARGTCAILLRPSRRMERLGSPKRELGREMRALSSASTSTTFVSACQESGSFSMRFPEARSLVREVRSANESGRDWRTLLRTSSSCTLSRHPRVVGSLTSWFEAHRSSTR